MDTDVLEEVRMDPTDRPARILVVDDDRALADLFCWWLDEKWHCEAVYSGEAALSAVGEDTDLVLLDRQMPGHSGEEVLEGLRERGLSVRVMMVSGVPPGPDLATLPVDDYVRKPPGRSDLESKVERLLLRRTYCRSVQRYLTCVAKLEVIEESASSTDLAEDERYLALRSAAEELRRANDAVLGRLSRHVDTMYGRSPSG
jgi:DNA-binding response OmpR family regulator